MKLFGYTFIKTKAINQYYENGYKLLRSHIKYQDELLNKAQLVNEELRVTNAIERDICERQSLKLDIQTGLLNQCRAYEGELREINASQKSQIDYYADLRKCTK